ncbi:MAG: universal stress protein [Pseudomonadales bacterium]
MRVIFVPVADRPECARALHTAFDLGQRLGANLCGCHIRAHGSADVALPSSLGSLVDYDAAWRAASTGKKTQKSSAAAKALFGKIAERQHYQIISKPGSSPGAMWMEKVGSPDKVLSIMGPVSDLIIVSRPAPNGGKLARMFMLAALLNSSRPVLVLPQTGMANISKRISIAWNQSAEAANTVSAAIPLLRLAEHVNIITCGPESGLGPKSTQLATYLRFWGVKAERSTARGVNDAKALVKGYKDAKSDLLLMGAYSRSRLRERVFGGVTEFMLQQANIPVLMLHT